MDPRLLRPSPSGLAPYSSGRVPGPLGAGASVHLAPARPIVSLDSSWSPGEQAKILAALQELTGDLLTQTGLEIFSDGSSKVANRKTGETLLRGLQHPTRKVIIRPATGSMIPDTASSPGSSDVFVELTFVGKDLATFDFFTITGANALGPGGNAIEKSPGFIPLAHELVHAFRMLRSVRLPGARNHEFFDPWGNKFTESVFLEELTVVGIDGSEPVTENRIRAEHRLGSREAYASPTFPLDMQGVKPASAPPPWWPNCPTP
jgi:Effector protein